MTAREALHQLLDRLSDEEVAALLVLLESRGRSPAENGRGESHGPAWIEGADYPALVALWDNDDDAVFDEV